MTASSESRSQKIKRLFTSEHDSERVEAVKLLVKTSSPQVIPFLKKASEDENVAVRYYAKKGLKLFARAMKKQKDGGELLASLKDEAAKLDEDFDAFESVPAPLLSPSVTDSIMTSSYVMNPVLQELRAELHRHLEEDTPEEDDDSSLSMTMSSTVIPTSPDYERAVEAALKILEPVADSLRNVLTSARSANVIGACAQALGYLGDTSAVNRLLDIVKAGSVTTGVIEALSLYDDSRVVTALEKIVTNERLREYHYSAVKGLLTVKDESSVSLIQSIIKGSDTSLQCAAIRRIAETGDHRFVAPLLAITGRVPEFVDYEVLRALYVLAPDHPDVSRELLSRFDHCNSSKIIASLISVLGNSGNPSYKDWVSAYLQNEDRRVRANAVEALGGLNLDIAELKSLLVPLVKDPDNRISSNASMMLAKRQVKEGWDGLLRMLNRTGKWYRASACYALGQLKHKDAIPILSFALSDRDSDVRLNAVKSLRWCVDHRAESNLCEALLDRNRWIRRYALEALSEIDSDDAQQRIRRYLGEETNNHNLTVALVCAAKAAKRRNDRTLLPVLFDFMTDECDKVRTAAIKALENLIGRGDLPGLTRGLADNSSDVRAATVIAMWKQGEFSICESLKSMLDTGDGLTCHSAALVVTEIGRLLRNLDSEPNTKSLMNALKEHNFYRRN